MTQRDNQMMPTYAYNLEGYLYSKETSYYRRIFLEKPDFTGTFNLQIIGSNPEAEGSWYEDGDDSCSGSISPGGQFISEQEGGLAPILACTVCNYSALESELDPEVEQDPDKTLSFDLETGLENVGAKELEFTDPDGMGASIPLICIKVANDISDCFVTFYYRHEYEGLAGDTTLWIPKELRDDRQFWAWILNHILRIYQVPTYVGYRSMG